MKPTSVMIVEYNTDLCDTLRHAFEDRGYITWTFPNPDIAVSVFSTIQPAVIVLDLDVAGSQAFEMMEACKVQCPEASLIVKSGTADSARMQKAKEHGAEAFLVKPYALAPLFEILDRKVPPKPPAIIPINQAA